MDSSTKFEMVRVTWHDAHSALEEGWVYPEDIEDFDPLPVIHVGLLLPPRHGGKKGHVTLCFGMTDWGAFDTRIHIPRNMVVSIEKLSVYETKRLARPTSVSSKSGGSGSKRGGKVPRAGGQGAGASA